MIKLIKNYWFRRIVGSLVVLLVVLILNFFLFRIMPGDPVSTIIDPHFSPQAKQHLRAQFGLDLPLYQQFYLYVKSLVTFNFGQSFLSQKPVWEELRTRIPNTVFLLGTAFMLSALLGIWLGVKAAQKRGSVLEKVVLLSGSISFSFPSFFVQLVLLMIFGWAIPIFPIRGSLSVPPPSGMAALWDFLWHMTLPIFSLVLLGFGSWAIYVRNLMIKTFSEDYILLARAKGLPENKILWGHAFRASLPPIVTMFLLALPGILSGAVITETVFSLHGVGKFLLDSILGHDYPAAGAAFYLLAIITIICNLTADFAYGLVDPRIRLGRKME